MKSRTLICVSAITLFAAQAFPVWVAAQGQTTHFRHYKLIDIGTFGGPASYINAPFALGAPNQINNRKTAVGSASTDTPSALFPSKAICGGVDGIVPFVFHAFEWQNGQKKDLGALGKHPATECSEAVSINANGEIEDLGTIGGSFSVATRINSRGQVVGFAQNAIEDPFSLLYSTVGITNGTQTRGFLWQNSHMQDLGTLGGPDAQAFALNENGEAAGISYTDSTPNPATGLPTADPFLWTEGRGMIDLGSLGGVWGTAGLLNNRGQVVGSSSVAVDSGACFPNINDISNCHPFFWEDGHLTDMNTDTIGGNPITANALNDAGEVVGTAAFPDRPFSDAYVWRKGVASDLGVVDDDCFSEAFAINSRSQIVGQSFSCVLNIVRTFLWENGSLVDLNEISSPNSLQLIEAFAITDDGVIGGIGVPPGCPADDRCGHAYVLIPVCADGNEGCADAPLDPAVVAQSRAESGVAPKTMTAEELAKFKERIARMAGRYRRLRLWPNR